LAVDDTGSLEIRTGRLARCPSCQSWTYLPRPSAPQQAAIHDNAEYFQHDYFRGRREDKANLARRCQSVFSQVAEVADLRSLRGERLLDIGCDTGSFALAAAEGYGLVPMGVDVAARAVAEAQARGVHACHGEIGEAPAEFSGFRMVTAVDIIEHTVDPGSFLLDVSSRMALGGLLYVQTPNFDSTVYQVGRRLCRLTAARPRALFERLFPPQHIQYISRRGLGELAARSRLAVISLRTRVLPAADVAASPLVREAVMALQGLDVPRREAILICAVLRKEAS
jgi:2-polyprenyl-3-methyl-5-hydroxy-6-metoxy-1,4-benzoquinol methylase